jgi:hypothetical protein
MVCRMRLDLGIDVEPALEEMRILFGEAPWHGRIIARFLAVARHRRHRLAFIEWDGLSPEPPQERIEVHLGSRIGSSQKSHHG